MRIDDTIFSVLTDRMKFRMFVAEQYTHALSEARLFPRFSQQSLDDAHQFWCGDISRVSDFELGGSTPDYYKQCGHLIYWLRRTSPVIEFIDDIPSIQDAPGYPLSEEQNAYRDLVARYGNEYLAFDLGFRIARFWDAAARGYNEEDLLLPTDYIKVMVHFLKAKNVSPHAMYLILKSLFLNVPGVAIASGAHQLIESSN